MRVWAAAVLWCVGASGAAGPPEEPAAVPKAAAGLAAEAERAVKAGQRAEAARLYGRAVAAAPRWAEGWWHLGSLQYEAGQFAGCRHSFQRFTALEPAMGRGAAFLGLCEYGVKEYDAARAHLEQAYVLGLPAAEPLTRAALYHAAVLQTRAGNFERALQWCRLLVRWKANDPAVVAVAGLAGLRRAQFPQELAEGDRDVVFKLGSALLTGGPHPLEEARRRFDALLQEYPKTPNVHYAYAMILLANDPDQGVAALEAELALDPAHLPALVSMGFEYLKRGDPKKALPYAERAVAAGPANFAARGCLGQALLEAGEPARGAQELEEAVRLAPKSAQLHFLLASAYAKLGRKAEAARERAEFGRLRALKGERAEGEGQ